MTVGHHAEGFGDPGGRRQDRPVDVVAVRYGTRSARRSDVFLRYSAYGDADGPIEMDYYFWVVRHSGRIAVVDTGFNETSGGSRGRTMLIPPADALAGLDVDPAEVDTVVLTHGHYDHIGNLDLFPRATFVISGAELDFWTGPMGRRELFAESAEAADIELLRDLDAAGRVVRMADEWQLAPGITVHRLGGHTPGQTVVKIDTEDGAGDGAHDGAKDGAPDNSRGIVLASDALHYYEEAELDRPFSHVADLAAMYAGFDRLNAWGEQGWRIVAGHDPLVRQRFPAVDGNATAYATRII